MGKVKKSLGFTLLEFIVVVCLISILFVVAVDRLLPLQEQAEKTSVQHLVGIMQSALALEIAAHVAKDKLDELHKLIGTNPMDLLADVPQNYHGALKRGQEGQVRGGEWYFDPQQRLLVYRVANEAVFETDLPGPKRLRIKIFPVFDDNNNNGRFDRGLDTLRGLSLNTLESYTWLGTPLLGPNREMQRNSR